MADERRDRSKGTPEDDPSRNPSTEEVDAAYDALNAAYVALYHVALKKHGNASIVVASARDLAVMAVAEEIEEEGDEA